MPTSSRTCVITGAAGVLCSTFARALAADGWKLALLDLNGDAANALADEINAAGGTARAYGVSVLDKAALEATHAAVTADLGPATLLINGAGGNNPRATTTKEYFFDGDQNDPDLTTFFNLNEAGFDFVFDLNIKGTLLPTQVFAADMIGREGCSIINISSMNAFRPLTKIPAYSAAKAAVSNFTQWLAVHFAGTGIRVNAIAPGFFVTAQNKALLFNEDGTPTPRTGKILAATPMGRFGKPEELLGTLRWLIDAEAASFVTGIVVPVDGGFSAYSGV